MTDDYGSYIATCGAPDFELDPDSTDYVTFNLVQDLDGDTISSFDIVLPDGLTEVSSSNDDTTVTVYLTGASCGVTYRVTCRYVTVGGSTRDKTVRVIGRSQ